MEPWLITNSAPDRFFGEPVVVKKHLIVFHPAPDVNRCADNVK